jgi:hypothetical protein
LYYKYTGLPVGNTYYCKKGISIALDPLPPSLCIIAQNNNETVSDLSNLTTETDSNIMTVLTNSEISNLDNYTVTNSLTSDNNNENILRRGGQT